MTKGYRPMNLSEALSLRGRRRTLVYAGGTDVMPGGRSWTGVKPRLNGPVMFIGHLPELTRVEKNGSRLAIGACATLNTVMQHPDTPGILKEIIRSMASPGVRNLATMGGNICNASPAGDTLPYLYAMEAELVLCNSARKRRLGIDDFICGPGKTALLDDELLTEIILPPDDFNLRKHQKVAARKANALSKVSFLGLARKKDRVITDLRLALGAVSPTMVRSRKLEQDLLEIASLGSGWEKRRFASLLDSYARLINPVDDHRSSAAYRRRTALRLLEYFLVSLV